MYTLTSNFFSIAISSFDFFELFIFEVLDLGVISIIS